MFSVLAILVGVHGFLIWGLFCIFLMTNNFENLFMSQKRLSCILFCEVSFQAFYPFVIGLFVLSLLTCKSSHMLDMNFLSDNYVVNIFFQSEACLLIFRAALGFWLVGSFR